MSTLVEAVSVVIPRHVLDVSYPGGSDAYLEGARRTAGVRFVIADARLTSVSLPTLDDAAQFVRPLESIGLTTPDGRPLAIACVDEHFGPTGSAPWLRWRRHDDGYTSCWLEWTEPGELTAPDGWPARTHSNGRVSGQTTAAAAQMVADDQADATVATLVAEAPPAAHEADPFENGTFDAESFAETSFEGPTFDELASDRDAFGNVSLGDGSFEPPSFEAPSFGASSPFAPPPLDPSLQADDGSAAESAPSPELLDDLLVAAPPVASHDENGVRHDAAAEPDPTVASPTLSEAAPMTLTLAAPDLDALTTADAVPALVDAMRQGLDRRGWRHSLDDGQRSFFYQVAGTRASYPGSAALDAEAAQVRVYTHLPVRVPEHRRAEAVELLTRANHGLPLGNFEFDYRDGEVRFKATAEACDTGLRSDTVDRLLQAGLAACDRFHDPLMQVIYGGVGAVGALEGQGA